MAPLKPATETEPEPEPPPSRGRVLRAATLVSLAFIVSRLLGFLRGAIILAIYGVDSLEVNAYEIASRFPDAIFFIIAGGALGSAFIPIFSAFFVRDDEKGGWRLFSAVINLITIVLVIICGLAVLFTEEFLSLLYGPLMASQPGLLEMTASLMRVMLISTVIFGMSGVFMAALNARQHFLLPAIAPILYNLGIIAGTLLLAPNIMGVAFGTVVGAASHMLVQIPGLARQRAHYQLLLTVRDRSVIRVIRLMIPRVLGLSFSQLNHILIQILGQTMLFGSIPALGNAWRVLMVPHGAIGQALAIVAFPTFAMLAAQNALDQMRRILTDTLRLILFLGIPATILLALLGRPLVSILFERGEFDAAATELVAWALSFYALGLVALAVIEVVSRAFYAMEDTWTPVLAGAAQILFMGLLAYWLSFRLFADRGWPLLGGLALAVSVSSSLEAVGLLWLLRRKMGGVNGREIADGLWRMSVSGGGMAIVIWYLGQQLQAAPALWQVLVGGLIGGAAYLGAGWLLRVAEVHQLAGYLLRRLRRG